VPLNDGLLAAGGGGSSQVNVPSKDGASPLLVAMRHKLDDQWHITEPILKLLIDKGCDVNLPNVSGITPLHQAVTRQQILTVEWLLQHRADPNLANDAGDTAMHAVVRTDNEIIAKLLIANNADPLVRNTEGKTPLALARSMSQSLFEMIQESDGQGAAAHYGPEADEIGQTALHRAVMENQAEQAYQLLQEGSSVNFADRYGFTPLLMAAQRGYIDLVLLFLTIPATKLTVYVVVSPQPEAKRNSRPNAASLVPSAVPTLAARCCICWHKPTFRVRKPSGCRSYCNRPASVVRSSMPRMATA